MNDSIRACYTEERRSGNDSDPHDETVLTPGPIFTGPQDAKTAKCSKDEVFLKGGPERTEFQVDGRFPRSIRTKPISVSSVPSCESSRSFSNFAAPRLE